MDKWISPVERAGSPAVLKGQATTVEYGLFETQYGTPDNIKTAISKGLVTTQKLLDMYSGSPQLQRAINYFTSAFQTTPYEFREIGKLNSPANVVYDGLLPEILSWGNADTPTGELFEQIAFWAALTSGFYVAIEPTPKQYIKEYNAPDLSLYVLLPQFVTPGPNVNGLKTFMYTLPNEDPIFFPAHSIMDYQRPSPFDNIVRHNDLGSVAISSDIYNLLRRGLKNNNANAAMFSGVLTAEDEVTNDQRQEIRRQVRERSMSPTDSYRILILEKGVRFTQMMMQGEDKYASQLADFVNRDIYTALGVPQRLAEGTGDGKELEQLEYLFYTHRIAPLWQVFSQKFNRRLGHLKNGRKQQNVALYPNFRLVPIYQKYALDTTRQYVADIMCGVATINEIRLSIGKAPLTGDFAEFADTPFPLYKLEHGISDRTDVTPSLDVGGSEGGRDQSSDGEAELIDTTGQKSFDELINWIDRLVNI